MIAKQLPETEFPLVIRTDFSDDAAWENLCTAIQNSSEVQALQFLSDIEYSNLTTAQLLEMVSENCEHSLLVIADQMTFLSTQYALCVVNLEVERGREFRALPETLFLVSANFTVANMDFSDFADAVGEDGVFRGFDEG